MAISRETKKALVAQYVDLFSGSEALILADYRGLTVADVTRLRRKIREGGSSFHIVKNTLCGIALQKAGLPVPARMLEGPTAIGFCQGDISSAAKTLLDFARETRILQIKGGLLGARVLDAEQVSSLADLPSREVLLAQTLAGLQSPLTAFLSVLGGTLRSMVYVLQARVDQLQEQSLS